MIYAILAQLSASVAVVCCMAAIVVEYRRQYLFWKTIEEAFKKIERERKEEE